MDRVSPFVGVAFLPKKADRRGSSWHGRDQTVDRRGIGGGLPDLVLAFFTIASVLLLEVLTEDRQPGTPLQDRLNGRVQRLVRSGFGVQLIEHRLKQWPQQLCLF